MEEQVRTKIALAMGNSQFDTILSDISPEFTESQENDGVAIAEVLYEAMYFSNLFLKKGGKLVCKVLHSNAADLLEGTSIPIQKRASSSSTRPTPLSPQCSGPSRQSTSSSSRDSASITTCRLSRIF